MGRLLNWLVAGLVLFFLAGLALPAMQSRCRGGRRLQSASNLRQIGLGLIGYSDRYHHLPPGATFAPGGSPLHGWPALILPYVDNAELYDAMNFARPWDDSEVTAPPQPSNSAITGTGIGIYKNPGVWDVAETMRSTAFGYATNSWIISGARTRRIDEFRDGDSRTILAGEVGGDHKPWGQPVHGRDPGLGINKTPRGFGGPWPEGGANFLFADGAVRFLRDDTNRATFRALATPDGGEKDVEVDELE